MTKFRLIAGPCQAEGVQHSVDIAGAVNEVCQRLGIDYTFKASFDKANRTSSHSKRGLGIIRGLECLSAVRTLGIKTTTDVHEPWQCDLVGQVVTAIQIPAFLCRQTDLLIAAAQTGRPVNVKKGQWMAPEDMGPVAQKLRLNGCDAITLIERGTSFGYHNLVVDFRSLVEMQALEYPVIFDATHSVQRPGGNGNSSGGDRRYVAPLARAAVAVGCDGLFIETHPDPDNAPSDGPNMVPLRELGSLLEECMSIRGF